MANPLPILRNTTGTLNAQVLYGFTRTVSHLTTVRTFMNGVEQRWASRPAPLFSFTLPMQSLRTADKTSWLTFLNSVKGRQAQDLTLSLGATAYANLTMMADDLGFTVSKVLQYDQQVNLRQVLNYPYTPPAAASAFPTFSWGGSVQMPFGQSTGFLSNLNESAYGPRFVMAYYGASLTGFPTGALKKWRIAYPVMPDADAATLETFVLGQQGRLGSFDFTDPVDSTTYHHVRIDQDDIEFKYIAFGQQSTSISLRQTNNS